MPDDFPSPVPGRTIMPGKTEQSAPLRGSPALNAPRAPARDYQAPSIMLVERRPPCRAIYRCLRLGMGRE